VLPGRFELPFKQGDEVSVEKADEVQAAGSDYLVTSGDNAIDTDTAVGTKITFDAGRFAVAGANDTAWFKLSAQLGNDADGDNLVRFEKVGP